MYTAIKNYCDNGENNGLFLLDMPTGFGKTHSVLDYIYDASLDESNRNKKFFFITTLKKNLPYEDLKKRFEKDGRLDQFYEKVLFIDSNADFAINNLNKIEYKIPEDIKKTDEYIKLSDAVDFLTNEDIKKNVYFQNYIENKREELRINVVPKFMSLMEKMLREEFHSVDERRKAIKTHKRWRWLGILYPTVFTRDRQIIFMSMNKFLVKNKTMVEPSYLFYNSDLIKDAVIFIDEFDATKETMLNSIIENGLRDKIDHIELFKDIYSALHTVKFPAELTKASKKREEGKYKDQPLQFTIDRIHEKADEIYHNYHLQFSHRTSADVVDHNKNFLFHDYKFHTIVDGKKSNITIVSDMKNRINEIRFSSVKPTNEKNRINNILGNIRGFIKYFQTGIRTLADNYTQRKAESKQNDEHEFSRDSAIRSILNLFQLKDEFIDYITSQIMNDPPKVKNDIKNSNVDLSFYEKGFRFYSFVDNDVHDMQSKIMMCSFETTPEKILLHICEKAKVIGISATATIPTVIGNYDLNYLRSKMQTNYSLPSEEDQKRLHSAFENSLSGYDQVSIHVELLGEGVPDNYSECAWKSVFDTPEIAKTIYNTIELEFDVDPYVKERYVRIALAYKKFVQHDDIQSFLCVLTKHPREGDENLNRKILDEIFKYIINENNASIEAKTSVYQLDGSEFDTKKDDIIEKLSQGEKLFVISVYQTIGAGQNLQYKIPSGLENEMIKIGDRASRGEKDFDAIYLDKPTNLLVTLSDHLKEEDFVKYLFHTEFLQEAYELSEQDASKYIKKAFRCYVNQKEDREYDSNIYNCKSVFSLSTRIIIQAIGRICRTNMKRKNIYIYADSRIADTMDTSILKDRMLNRELKELAEKVEKLREKEESEDSRKNKDVKKVAEVSLEDKAALVSRKFNYFIRGMLRDAWTEERIQQWQQLRNLVLTSPTMSEAEVSENFIASQCYVRMPEKNNRIFYHQEGDYSETQIGFKKEKDLNLEVSDVESKLTILMSLPELKNYFIENGWATSFKENDYIMCPPLFNNIYKGALGEVVGKYLFERFIDCDIQEISDVELFELFDYKLNDSIYIDFKNWHETTVFNDEEMLNKIEAKAKKCECKYVIIANIISEKDWENHRIKRDGLTIVEIPSLLTGKFSLRYNDKAINEIRRCVNECSN